MISEHLQKEDYEDGYSLCEGTGSDEGERIYSSPFQSCRYMEQYVMSVSTYRHIANREPPIGNSTTYIYTYYIYICSLLAIPFQSVADLHRLGGTRGLKIIFAASGEALIAAANRDMHGLEEGLRDMSSNTISIIMSPMVATAIGYIIYICVYIYTHTIGNI